MAPEEYKRLGQKLSHRISRIDGYRGSFQILNNYSENSKPAIFLGSPAENFYTDKYLSETDNLTSYSGACYAYRKSRAVIFGDGDIESALELKKVLQKYGINLIKAKRAIPSIITKNLRNFRAKGLFNNTFPPMLSLLQTDAAASLFLEEAFADWLRL